MLPGGYSEYLTQLVETISHNYQVARERYASDAIHDFRVGVKRFRSFLKLSHEIMPGALDHVSIEPLVPVYKAAGKIRDAQVQLELVDKLTGGAKKRLKEFTDYLSRREAKGQLKLAGVQGDFNPDLFADVSEQLHDAARSFDAAVLLEASRACLQTAMTGLYAAAEMAEDARRDFEELHEVRIHAKRVRYIVEVIQTEDAASEELAQLNKRLRGVHRALGLWHDAEVGMQLMDKFRRKHADLPARARDATDEYARLLAESVRSGLKGYDKAWQWFARDFGPQTVA